MNQLENVYVRGSKIRFLIIPDMLKNAPLVCTDFWQASLSPTLWPDFRFIAMRKPLQNMDGIFRILSSIQRT